MATIKVIFRAYSSTGTGTLFYRIIRNRKIRQINSGHRVMRNEWDSTTGKVTVPADEDRRTYIKSVQNDIDRNVARLRKIVSRLEKENECFTADEVIAVYKSSRKVAGFIAFGRELTASLISTGRLRLADHYTTALNRLSRFTGDSDIEFYDFNSALMERFESHLKDNMICLNTISYYMRNLRAIFNKAVERHLTDSRNPFKRVYTGIAKTVKRAVSVDIVKDLHSLDLRGDRHTELARDIFMFSFFTRGMAFIDVAFLRKQNLKKGTLSYHRHKTGQRLIIKWEPQMQQIVEKYSCPTSDYMFPIIDSSQPDHYRQYRLAYNKLLRRLRKLGDMLGLTEPLTFHCSRHSWASIARNNNVPLSVICEGMGHDSEKTTRIYLASIDTSLVDKANSEIINMIDR